MENYDIIIIGAGPAGLTAGLYAGRQNSKALVIDKGLSGGAGSEVPMMENYPGFDLISGMELISKIIGDDFNEYLTKSVILATGASHKHLDVPGESEFLGRGVAYCATCDGMFFVNRDVLMVGGGNSAAQEALYLNNIGCNVKIVHRRDSLRCEHRLEELLKEKGIEILWNSTIKDIKGGMAVDSVTLVRDGVEEEYKTDAVFVAIGDAPSNDLAKQLGVELDENGYIITDKSQATNVSGVYAAGDITGGVKQWIVACGEGAVAAISAYQDSEL